MLLLVKVSGPMADARTQRQGTFRNRNIDSRTSYSTRLRSLLAAAALLGTHLAASAAPVTTTVTVLPGDPSWSTIPGENSGGGSSTINATLPINGNGSIEMFGDRTRFSMGNYYSPTSNLGLLSAVTQLTFDWAVAVGSTNPYNPDYTPALAPYDFTRGGSYYHY